MSAPGSPAIAELVTVCARQQALSWQLFEALGRWAGLEHDDPVWSRLFAEACHRHAWHAELWSERRPVVPIEAPSDEPVSAAGDLPAEPAGDAIRLAWYRRRLGEIDTELAALGGRVDADLDPATHRTVTLVRRDLAELAARVAATA